MAVGSLVVRASDSRLESLGSMPDATKYLPSTHGGKGDFRLRRLGSLLSGRLSHCRGIPTGLETHSRGRGHGSRVVKVSDHAWRVMRSSPVPLKTRRVAERWMLNLSRAETSSRWSGVVVRRERGQLRCRPRHFTMV
ncbi:uncharacterized protein TNCV_3832331 [Trichonephila clavipes]|nr:uncharacterized protein TNCV_3832331 [Trichonephila clavipes]